MHARNRAALFVGLFLVFTSSAPSWATGSTLPAPPAWVARFDGPADIEGFQGEGFNDVVLDPSGVVAYAAGQAQGDSMDGIVAAADARSGAPLWARLYDGPATEDVDWASAISAAPDGTRVFATGTMERGALDRDAFVLALDAATGALVWEARLDRGDDVGTGIAAGQDGRLVFVSAYAVVAGNGDAVIAAYDAATGAEVWRFRYDFAGEQDWVPYSAIATVGDRVFAAFTSENTDGDYDYLTVGLHAGTGDLLWSTRIASPLGIPLTDQVATSLVADQHGNVYVSGFIFPIPCGIPFATCEMELGTPITGSIASMIHYLTVSLDGATGDVRWQSESGPLDVVDFLTTGMDVAPDGSLVAVTGVSRADTLSLDGLTGGYWTYTVYAYEGATGDAAWTASYGADADYNDVSWAVAFSPEGHRVYVTGESFTAHGPLPVAPLFDVATVALDAASGAQVGVMGYDGPKHGWDGGFALAAGRDGLVLTAGLSESDETSFDSILLGHVFA